MKKQLIVIGTAVLLLVVGLSGCTQNNESKDFDGDGHPDSNDDFPYDDRYYIKAKWGNWEYTEDLHMELEGNQGHGTGDYLSSDWRYVVINWSVIEPTNLTKEQEEYIFLTISTPEYPSEIEYSYDSTGNRTQKIFINANNWGNWRIGFRNKNALYTEDITVTIEFDLYKVR